MMNYFVYTEELIKIDANPKQGFNYGYYLYIPNGVKQSEVGYLLVEPNNTGYPSDDNSIHKKEAKEQILHETGNYISKELKIPLLVPFFDRPASNVKMYTHSLDSDTLKKTDAKLARIDLQLINMIKDAKSRLFKRNIYVKDKVFLNGFSASGSFTNRFTALHPEIVKAVVSGGVNCMPIIPSKEWKGKKLPFHIGVANIKEIAGIEFNLDEYKRVAQYIYMGELDDNDTLPYDDAFNRRVTFMNVDVIFSYLFIGSSLIIFGLLLYVIIRKKSGNKLLLQVKIRKSKFEKLIPYIYYIVFVVSFPAFIYDIIQTNSLHDTSQHLFFTIMSIFFIYYYRSYLRIYNNGINYMDTFIKWENINKYQIEENKMKLDVNGKSKEYGLLLSKKQKDELINIFQDKLK